MKVYGVLEKKSMMISFNRSLWLPLVMILSALCNLFGQDFSGEENVCQSINYVYTYADDVNYTSVTWSYTGSYSIISSSTLSKTLQWTSDGSVTVRMYNSQGVIVSTGTKNIRMYQIGTIYGPSSVCAGSAVTLSAPEAYGTIQWQKSTNGGSTWTNLASNTDTPSGNAQYRARLTNCASNNVSKNVISVTRVSAPVAGTMSRISGSVLCVEPGSTVTASFQIIGASPAVGGWEYRYKDGPSGSWTAFTNFSVSSATTMDYPVTAASATLERYYEFRSYSVNSPCPNAYPSTPVSFTVKPNPEPGTLSALQPELCNNTSLSVTLTPSINQGLDNDLQKREKNGSGSFGTWSDVINPIALSQTGSSTRTYEFRHKAYTSGCGVSEYSPPVSTVIFPPAAVGTLTSNTAAVCGSGSVTLSLSSYTGAISWFSRYKDGSAGTYTQWENFANGSQSRTVNVTSTSSAVRYYQFQVKVDSGPCQGVQATPIDVAVHPVAVAGVVGSLTSICGSGAVTLTESGKSGGTSYFFEQELRGVVTTVSNPASVPISPNGSTDGIYYFRHVAYNPACGYDRSDDELVIAYANSSVGVLSANSSTYCNGDAVNLTLASRNGSLAWRSRFKDGTEGTWSAWNTFSTSSGTTNSFQAAAGATVDRFYEVEVVATNGPCAPVTSNKLEITAKPFSAANPPSISPGTEFFQASPALNLSGSGVGSFSFESSTNGSSWNAVSQNPVNPVSVSTMFRTKAVSGTCAPAYSTPVTVNIYPNPVITVAGNQNIPVGGSTLLTVQNNFATYQWTKNGVDIGAANQYQYTVTEPGDYNVRVKASATSPEATALPKTIGSTLLQQPLNINFKVVTNFFREGATEGTSPYSLSAAEVQQNVTYMDGYGRSVQNVSTGASPQGKDIIQPYQYNAFGQKEYQFMAYPSDLVDGRYRANAIKPTGLSYSASEHYDFYSTGGEGTATDWEPRARTLYEPSPLGRVIAQGAPGGAWQPGSGHEVSYVTRTNHSTYSEAALKNIKIWTVDGPGSNYADNQLTISGVTDENGNNVWTFTDKLGRTVLKRVQLDDVQEGISTPFLETYYVYDDRGNLAMQVPPKAVAKLNSGTSWSASFRDEWCFTYAYDARNRLVEKKVPGQGVMYYAYDPLDRHVLSQDAHLRASNQWLFIKYDSRNRAVMTGLYTNATHTTRQAVQTNLLDPLYTSGVWYEERGTAAHGYTNQSFPMAGTQVLSVNYYDNYDFDHNGTPDYSYTVQNLPGENSPAASAFGLPTGNKRLQLGTSNWLYVYAFYDKYGRTIQVRSNNHLALAVNDLQTNVYDFKGQLLRSLKIHTGTGGATVTISNRYTYDHAGRLVRLYQRNNNDAEQVVAAYNYNELGQLIEKNIHCTSCVEDTGTAGQTNVAYGEVVTRSAYSASETKLIGGSMVQLLPGYSTPAGANVNMRIATPSADFSVPSGGTFLQSVDYRYNIRGWLTHINNA
ncbi:MAG: DUF6443 domain-containing protein, partial [Bacteroidota bacterium]